MTIRREEERVSGCVGCSCRAVSPGTETARLLLSSGVSHSLASMRRSLLVRDFRIVERAPGLIEVLGADLPAVMVTVRQELSGVEAAEVRVLLTDLAEDADLLAAALRSPSLAEACARVQHADLVPLIDDELNSFHSVYQPIVSLASDENALVGYEALLRATTAAGPLLPGPLFEAAAAAGWLHVLDRIGRTTALRDAAGWLGDSLLFVNFLPTTIYRPEVCLKTTEQAAESAGLRLEQLVFEVTESERVKDTDHLARVFAYYRERGCKVALDDLGSGYSSLNLLVRLRPDVVKLDKDIVQGLPGAVSAAVVKAVVQIVHSYGGLVLAECVETADQADVARELGVDLGQGWHFGRPARPAELTQPVRAATPRVVRPSRAYRTRLLDAEVEGLLGRVALEGSMGVTVVDAAVPDMPLIYVNAAFEQLTGYSADEVLGRNCRFLQGEGTAPEIVDALRSALRTGEEHLTVLRNYRKDGEAWWNELRLAPIVDSAGRLTHYFGFQNDVTARVEAELRVGHRALHDELTGLPNRANLEHALQGELVRVARAGTELAVLFIDLDGFKTVNDTLGHAAGDLVLIAAAHRLRGGLRDTDLLARLSGDEFVAVLSDVPPGGARNIAQRIADAVVDTFCHPLDVSGRAVTLGASIGVALYPEHGTEVEELMKVADRAMYEAKHTGRGKAVVARRSSVPAGRVAEVDRPED